MNNPLVNKFNQHAQQHHVPFQRNRILRENGQVLQQLDQLLKMDKSQSSTSIEPTNRTQMNIIDAILQPENVKVDNQDIEYKFQTLMNKRQQNIKPENIPYKLLDPSHAIQKPVDKVTPDDLIIEKVNKLTPLEKQRLNAQLKTYQQERQAMDEELDIEFHIDNYDKNKARYEYQHTFDTQASTAPATQDVVQFYRQSNVNERLRKLNQDCVNVPLQSNTNAKLNIYDVVNTMFPAR